MRGDPGQQPTIHWLIASVVASWHAMQIASVRFGA